jgi:hypothetical protein
VKPSGRSVSSANQVVMVTVPLAFLDALVSNQVDKQAATSEPVALARVKKNEIRKVDSPVAEAEPTPIRPKRKVAFSENEVTLARVEKSDNLPTSFSSIDWVIFLLLYILFIL